MTENELLSLIGHEISWNSMESGRRRSLLEEYAFLEQIRSGNYSDIKVHELSTIIADLGFDAFGIPYEKQCEYLCVVMISQSVRAAMEGGASPDTVNELGDGMLIRLSRTSDPRIMQTILEDTAAGCAYLVAKGPPRKQDELLRRCEKYISENLNEKIYLDRIAEELCVNASYLSHLFSTQKGITLQEYIQREKIKKASLELTRTDASVSEIARKYGYRSPSHFTEVFRKWKHMTPSQYREQYYLKK